MEGEFNAGHTGASAAVVTRPTLRKGASGPYVTECQEDLLKLGYDLAHYGADGKYGNITMREVRKFQKAQGLAVDGICGPKTWAALDAAVGGE
jgi:peptidoglycan hydrolase-like protein with peptidoglycan-binding domain